MKRNNENFIQSADILFILRFVLMECKDRAYWPLEETNILETSVVVPSFHHPIHAQIGHKLFCVSFWFKFEFSR